MPWWTWLIKPIIDLIVKLWPKKQVPEDIIEERVNARLHEIEDKTAHAVDPSPTVH